MCYENKDADISFGRDIHVGCSNGCYLSCFLNDMKEYMVEKAIDGTLDSDMNIAFREAVEFAESKMALIFLNDNDYKHSPAWKDIAINWVGNIDNISFEYEESEDRGIAVAIYEDEICPSIQLYLVSSWYEFLEKSRYLDTLIMYFNDEEDRENHLNWMSDEEIKLLLIANENSNT